MVALTLEATGIPAPEEQLMRCLEPLVDASRGGSPCCSFSFRSRDCLAYESSESPFACEATEGLDTVFLFGLARCTELTSSLGTLFWRLLRWL